jgi:hypothetical protein
LLAAEWPCGIPFDVLYQRSQSLLVEQHRSVPPDARRDLLDAITILFEAGQMDLRLREPIYRREMTARPRAHALARWEAECRDSLTTPHHLRVAFEAPALHLVRAMDGSRSRAELQDMFGSDLVNQTLPILARCGLLAQPESTPSA